MCLVARGSGSVLYRVNGLLVGVQRAVIKRLAGLVSYTVQLIYLGTQ